MKQQYIVTIFLILLIFSVWIDYTFATSISPSEDTREIIVGIDVAYNNIDEMYDIIDKVCDYTNLFVIGTEAISHNKTALSEACQYLYDQDMYFIIYTDIHIRLQLINDIATQYGDHFLGVYFDDEQGGRQLDLFEYRWVYEADDYSDASNQFVQGLKYWLNRNYYYNESYSTPRPSAFHLFTSDYTLYWYDYKSGYDTIFAEFGWNYSRQLNVALCRGAATVQNKDWGVIISWTYNNPPHLESGLELYDDLLLAYENGAKYIVIFDSNEDYSHEILQKEHLDALEQFWRYISNNQRVDSYSDRVAYVLPENYGYGFRGPDDKNWGLWEADSLSYEISVDLGNLLEEYENKLDIIYDDPQFNYLEKYSRIYFWNRTSILGNISCMVSSSSIPIGDSIEISGVVNPPVLSNVTLQYSIDNGTVWVDLATLPLTSEGHYSIIWKPDSVGSYDFKAILKEEDSISESTITNIQVIASKISTSITFSVSSSFITQDDTIFVNGFIDPPISNQNITLTIRRPDGVRLNKTLITSNDGSFWDSFAPEASGYWGVSAFWSGDSIYDRAFGEEQTFEVTNIYQSIGLQYLTLPIICGIIAGVSITVIVVWFVLRLRKKRASKSVIGGYYVKARLLGLGNGVLEFIDNNIKFTLNEGRLRKKKRVCRKIAIADIQRMSRIGNQLSIIWKGVKDVFIVEGEELTGTIFERIPESSRKERIVFEEKKAAKQSRNYIIKMLSTAMETVDSFFDILWRLKETENWNILEDMLDRCEENIRYLKSEGLGLVNSDFTDLSLAIKERDAELASKKAYNILKLLYKFFSGLSTTKDSLIESHPNFSDLKRIVLAYYLLNDIILALIVEDKTKEQVNLLVNILKGLSKDTGIKINADVITDAISELSEEQNKFSVIGKCRTVFREQLKKILTI
jgi:hypothetical protein